LHFVAAQNLKLPPRGCVPCFYHCTEQWLSWTPGVFWCFSWVNNNNLFFHFFPAIFSTRSYWLLFFPFCLNLSWKGMYILANEIWTENLHLPYRCPTALFPCFSYASYVLIWYTLQFRARTFLQYLIGLHLMSN
jgi:hypothetical protein